MGFLDKLLGRGKKKGTDEPRQAPSAPSMPAGGTTPPPEPKPMGDRPSQSGGESP